MKTQILSIVGTIALAVTGLFVFAPTGSAQRDIALLDPADAHEQLDRAQQAAEDAKGRAAELAEQAENTVRAADKSAREAAALAARIQQSEAEIAAAQARYSLAQARRTELSRRLAVRQQPLVRLTGALQAMSRRPLALSALQPGSLRETVYVRAVLDSAVPQVRARTAALRGDLEEGRALEDQARESLADLRGGEAQLRERRQALTQLEASQRLASREARSVAGRERQRALALAEDARDLDGLIGELGAASALRRELAALPGPVLRPPRPSASEVIATVSATPTPDANAPPPGFQLPVQGRTVAGFGELRDSGARSTGLVIAPASGAQVIAPAAGRVAFSGPYRGFGRIVIIEHAGGWTSLVTGLQQSVVEVGDNLVSGSPLGVASTSQPAITIELRRAGEPVNPLQFL
ncbi:MAG: peptidoglycan DD-metalloendopeptidase family protein [Pseudomonadota bacterium]